MLCAQNERVSNNACVACVDGYENDAGDDASGDDTFCVESSSSSSSEFPVALVALATVGGFALVGAVVIVRVCFCGSRSGKETKAGMEMHGTL